MKTSLKSSFDTEFCADMLKNVVTRANREEGGYPLLQCDYGKLYQCISHNHLPDYIQRNTGQCMNTVCWPLLSHLLFLQNPTSCRPYFLVVRHSWCKSLKNCKWSFDDRLIETETGIFPSKISLLLQVFLRNTTRETDYIFQPHAKFCTTQKRIADIFFQQWI